MAKTSRLAFHQVHPPAAWQSYCFQRKLLPRFSHAFVFELTVSSQWMCSSAVVATSVWLLLISTAWRCVETQLQPVSSRAAAPPAHSSQSWATKLSGRCGELSHGALSLYTYIYIYIYIIYIKKKKKSI